MDVYRHTVMATKYFEIARVFALQICEEYRRNQIDTILTISTRAHILVTAASFGHRNGYDPSVAAVWIVRNK